MGGTLSRRPVPMGRISYDWQVRKRFDHWNGRDVQRVACVRLKGTDATLAEDHVVIPPSQNIFGAQQQFFNGRRHATLK